MMCSKKELAKMLIESNKIVFGRAVTVDADSIRTTVTAGDNTTTSRQYPSTFTN